MAHLVINKKCTSVQICQIYGTSCTAIVRHLLAHRVRTVLLTHQAINQTPESKHVTSMILAWHARTRLSSWVVCSSRILRNSGSARSLSILSSAFTETHTHKHITLTAIFKNNGIKGQRKT